MEQKNIEISESTFMYIKKSFKSLNPLLFDIKISQNNKFKILMAYSFDNKNYSQFIEQDKYSGLIDSDNFELYVCIWFKRIISNDLSDVIKLYDKKPQYELYRGNIAYTQNVDNKQSNIIIESITYDNQQIDLHNDVEFKEHYDLINEFPRWNLYDNQQITIERWLEQCNAVAEMYGHTAIYFKTEAVNIDTELHSGIHGIHHTLQNNVIRNVVDIKKLHIMAPNNELPQDRVIYTDWDMPLQDDFVIHIVRQKFEQAFGLKAIPNEKDYIYLPIINKLFRVSTMQPKNGFMGVCGWYEVFLAKYEEDDCVRIDKDLKDATSNMNELLGFDENYGSFVEDNMVEISENLDNELSEIKQDEIYSKNKIIQETVEEKKAATNNYSNRLEDTTLYVSLKETDKIRELYDKRLEIVSVNPEDSVFQISMYNCSKIDKRTVAMRYCLTDYSVNNKFSNNIKSNYIIKFDIALLGRFSGELIDILSNNNVISTIACKRNQLHIFDTSTQTDAVISKKLEVNNLYQIQIEYSISGIYSFKVFTSENKQISLIYQNVYKLNGNQKEKIITNLNLFGGNYIIGNLQFFIDKQKFIDDKCLPLLNQFKF